jgi:hypothetical protein
LPGAISMDLLAENERYYADSQWFAWIGPKVADTDPDSIRLMAEVERVFQEANKVRECVDRHRRALTAKPAAWSFGEGASGDEAFLSQLLGWMIPRSARLRYASYAKEPIVFPHAIAEAVHFRLLGGTGYLRLWLPERFQNAPAYRRVALHAPHPNSVEVEDDVNGFPIRITYSYKVDNETYREVQELTDTGQTVFRIEDSAGKVRSEETLELGGRFTIVRLQGNPVVTCSVRRLQNGINYVLTLMIRNLQYGGFLRDIIINGLPPGEFDDNGNWQPDPDGWKEGPGLKMEVRGMPLFDAEGNVVGYTQPSIDTRNPVDVAPFMEAYKANAALFYEAFGQGHVLASDLILSGVSRQQLRQDFQLAVSEDASALRVALADLYAAAYLLAKPGSPIDLDIIVEPRLAIADPSPEDIDAAIKVYEAGLRSQRSSMALVGVENPEAELVQIESERLERIKAIEEQDLLAGTEDSEIDGSDDEENEGTVKD